MIDGLKYLVSFMYFCNNYEVYYISLTDTFLYFFAPGVTADPTGGGTIIPLTGDFTK